MTAETGFKIFCILLYEEAYAVHVQSTVYAVTLYLSAYFSISQGTVIKVAELIIMHSVLYGGPGTLLFFANDPGQSLMGYYSQQLWQIHMKSDMI